MFDWTIADSLQFFANSAQKIKFYDWPFFSSIAVAGHRCAQQTIVLNRSSEKEHKHEKPEVSIKFWDFSTYFTLSVFTRDNQAMKDFK